MSVRRAGAAALVAAALCAAAGCAVLPSDGPAVTAIEGVAPPHAPQRVVFAIDRSTPVGLYGLLVQTCGGAMHMWDIGQSYSTRGTPAAIVYGLTPRGFVERVPARPLVPGCYEVSTSGPRVVRFEVAADGAVTTAPAAER